MPKGKPRFPTRRCRVAASPFHSWNFGVSRDGLIIARTWHRDVAQEIAAALNVAEKARWMEEYELRIQIASRAALTGSASGDTEHGPLQRDGSGGDVYQHTQPVDSVDVVVEPPEVTDRSALLKELRRAQVEHQVADLRARADDHEAHDRPWHASALRDYADALIMLSNAPARPEGPE